jgi:preprotein translocase subunit SecF
MDDNRIGDRLSNAVDEAREGVVGAAETGSEMAGRVRTAASEAGSAIQNAAVGAAKQIGDAAAETYRQSVRVGKSVSQNTSEQPLLALLIAGAIGFGIGYMVSSLTNER